MNKQQLIEKIASETKLPKTQCENILNCAFDNIKKTVKKGDVLKIDEARGGGFAVSVIKL